MKVVMGDKIHKPIVRKLTVANKSIITVSWAVHDSVQAKVKMTVKRLLENTVIHSIKREEHQCCAGTDKTDITEQSLVMEVS